MIIGIDADGVCADMHAELLRRYNRDYDDNLQSEQCVTWDVVPYVKPECGSKIYDYFHAPDFYAHIEPIPGAQAGVRAIRELGHDVVFVTSNTWGMTDQKAEWFFRHGFLEHERERSLPREMVIMADKTKLDADLLIDDGPHHLREWVEHKRRRAIMVERPWNMHLLDDVPSAFWSWCARARHWQAIVREVERLIP